MDERAPEAVYVASAVGYYDALDLVRWAEETVPDLEYDDGHPFLVELMSLNTHRRESYERAPSLLKQYIEFVRPDYDLCSPWATAIAQTWLARRLSQYVAEACEPWRVCRMLGPLEHTYDYPDWIGDLYSACDWVGPETPPFCCPALLGTAKEILAKLRDLGVEA